MKKYMKEFAFSVVLLVMFNVIAFAVPFTKCAAFWMSYAFGLLAIVLFLGCCIYCDKSNEELRSKFYSWPIVRVAFTYGIIQVIASIVVMGIATIPNCIIPGWIIIVLYVLMLCIAVIGLIAADSAKEIVETIDEKIHEKVIYLRNLVVDVDGMMDTAEDAQLKKQLKELRDAIKYSNPMTNDQLYPLENRIAGECAELGELVERQNVENAMAKCNTLIKLLAERDRKSKLLK